MNTLDEVSKLLEIDQDRQLFRAVVVANSGNTVQIQRTGLAADTQFYPKLFGVTVIAGNEVLVARLGSGFVVVGQIIR